MKPKASTLASINPMPRTMRVAQIDQPRLKTEKDIEGPTCERTWACHDSMLVGYKLARKRGPGKKIFLRNHWTINP